MKDAWAMKYMINKQIMYVWFMLKKISKWMDFKKIIFCNQNYLNDNLWESALWLYIDEKKVTARP